RKTDAAVNIRSITAPNPGPFTLDGTRTYLLGDSIILDPGPAIESHIDAILAEMPRVRSIFITHRHGDHAPAALPLKERSGAQIIAPPGVLDATDRIVSDGEVIEGLEVIATPGHTILGSGTTTIFPPDGNMRDYIASLRRLRAREPKRIWPAHGPTRDDA